MGDHTPSIGSFEASSFIVKDTTSKISLLSPNLLHTRPKED